MDLTVELVLLFTLIAFVAFFVKAFTGFGPALVVVSFGSLILNPVTVVPVSALLDLTAGAVLTLMDSSGGGRRYWIPLAIAIVAGSVTGGVFLSLVPPDVFRTIVGVAVLVLGVWFAFGRTRGSVTVLAADLPDRASQSDLAACAAGGIMGGFIGISGPPILWHFGRKLAKEPLRRVLIPVFLAAAVARSATYAVTGMIDTTVLLTYAACLPGLVLGTFAGNHVFFRVSEAAFSRGIGVILVIVGTRLVL